MNFVFLNQYYPPDAAPTGVMLAGVVEELTKAGHEVTVICAKGGYASKQIRSDEEAGDKRDEGTGMRVLRVGATSFGRGTFLGKLVDYLSFYLGVAWALATLSCRGSGPQRIVALTTPPYLSLWARVFSKLHGADHAHWVMDLYPDVMEAHGMLKPGGIFNRVLGALTRWGFGGERCACVLSLGPDMAERVGGYLGEGEKSPWVPLWSSSTIDAPDAEKVSELRAARGWADDELVLMYSGNMGLGHLFDEVLEVAGKQGIEKWEAGAGAPRFVFYGGGKRRVEIEQFVATHRDAAVELHDYVDADDLSTHLASADVHLVSLRPEWDGAMVPSKLQGVFAIGRPVIFIGSEDSSIGQWVLESGAGWVVPPGDVEGLESAIAAAEDSAGRCRRGQLARDYASKHFDRESNAARVAALLAEFVEYSNTKP